MSFPLFSGLEVLFFWHSVSPAARGKLRQWGRVAILTILNVDENLNIFFKTGLISHKIKSLYFFAKLKMNNFLFTLYFQK